MNFVTAARLNHSLTARYEQRILQWMAQGSPLWVTPDKLTALALCAQLAAGAAFAAARWDRRLVLAAIACIVLNWVGDSMDGTLARVRQRQRPRYGFYVDHVSDIFGSVAMMSGLAVSGFVHPVVAVAMLIGFLILAGESFLATYTLSRFELSQGFFGPTEIRLLLIAGCLALIRSPYASLFGRRFLLFDAGGMVAATAMFLTAVVVSVRHTVQLYREEKLP